MTEGDKDGLAGTGAKAMPRNALPSGAAAMNDQQAVQAEKELVTVVRLSSKRRM